MLVCVQRWEEEMVTPETHAKVRFRASRILSLPFALIKTSPRVPERQDTNVLKQT